MRRVLLLALLSTGALGLANDAPSEPVFETSLDYAQVEFVAVEVRPDGTLRVDVTVRHADDGWDHYADAWQLVDVETGEVLAERELLHPHVNEQPFTRSLSGVRLPEGTTSFVVRARCQVHGFGGREVRVDLATTEGEGYVVRRP